jgi:hypothetical protein
MLFIKVTFKSVTKNKFEFSFKEYLQGSPEKAFKNFGWKPKISFEVNFYIKKN